MNITKKDVAEFQALYKKHFNKDIGLTGKFVEVF